MPILQYIQGDLLSHNGPIAHGCSAQDKMNSGVAKAIRKSYPDAYDVYANWPDLKLGGVIPRFISEGFTSNQVYSIIVQTNYGYDGMCYVNSAAVASAFNKLNHKTDLVLGIPKIGAGLGGGNWGIIERVINDATPDLPIYVYVLPV